MFKLEEIGQISTGPQTLEPESEALQPKNRRNTSTATKNANKCVDEDEETYMDL